MLKEFNELMKLDLSKETQKKPTFYKDKSTGNMIPTSKDKWLDYIEWAKVLSLLYENGAKKVSFFSDVIRKNEQLFLKLNLKIDENEYTLDYPVIDGNSVKTNPNQLEIHKVELRAFVKCVAINTGLGLSLWLKEERKLNDIPLVTDERKKVDYMALGIDLDLIKTVTELKIIYKKNQDVYNQDVKIVQMFKDRIAKIEDEIRDNGNTI
jgi:hypothetical protein